MNCGLPRTKKEVRKLLETKKRSFHIVIPEKNV